MEVKIINEIRDEIKIFKSIEEFNIYYQKNKESMEKLTTNHLNKVFKIELPDGTVYRITKKNCGTGKGKTLSGDIYLKKVIQPKNKSITNLSEEQDQPWETAIEGLKADVGEQIRLLDVKLEQCIQNTNALQRNYLSFESDVKNRIAQISDTVNILAKVVNTMQGYE